MTRQELEKELSDMGIVRLCEDRFSYDRAWFKYLDGNDILSQEHWDLSDWIFEYIYGIVTENDVEMVEFDDDETECD